MFEFKLDKVTPWKEVRYAYFVAVLKHCKGNVTHAAKAMKISYKTLCVFKNAYKLFFQRENIAASRAKTIRYLNCVECGKNFPTDKPLKLYCSYRCSDDSNYRKRKERKKCIPGL